MSKSLTSGADATAASQTRTFGELTVDKRVLTTRSRTIAIRNIATVTVGTHVEARSSILLLLTIVFGLMALAALTSPAGGGAAAAILALVAVVCAILYFRPEDQTHYLLISTSDGVLSRFTGPNRQLLNDVRDLLTEKINGADETSTFNINFENGTIESLNVAQAGTVHQATHVSGSGHTIASGNATAVGGHGHGHTVQTANGGNGKVATADTNTSHSATNSPGAQQGANLGQTDAAHAVQTTTIDFSHYLPAVADMQRFYARQANAEHLEQRLSELELLMRAGAPEAHQKSRVRELAGDLVHYLQAYPPAVQIFQHIANLVA